MLEFSRDIAELVHAAPLATMTVAGRRGSLHTDVVVPLWDGERVLITTNRVLSRKSDSIRRNPRVALTFSSVHSPLQTVTIQGVAAVLDEDADEAWSQVLPLWKLKEPVLPLLMRLRSALPLFWQRDVIEVTPTRVSCWLAAATNSMERLDETA